MLPMWGAPREGNVECVDATIMLDDGGVPRDADTLVCYTETAIGIQDLEVFEGELFDESEDLSPSIRECILCFPVDARLPIWKTNRGERLFRLPEAPRIGLYARARIVLVYPVDAKHGLFHHYVSESDLQRTDETDALATAMARIYYVAILTRNRPNEYKAARAMLLRDYHPDKTRGSAMYATTIQYIKKSFAR